MTTTKDLNLITRYVKIETRYIKDGLVVHEDDLGYDLNATVLRNLSGRYGAGGWTLSHRTVYKTVEATDWR